MRTLVSSALFLFIAFWSSGFELAGDQDLRHFDQEQITVYKADPAFDYSTDYAKSGSLINLFFIYILDMLGSIFRASGFSQLWPFIFRILIVVVILAVLYYILKNRYGSVIETRSRNFVPMGVSVVADQHLDYDQLIRESRESGDYKLAIRYLFLKCLNDLNQSNQIKITTWKAPLDYVDELPSGKQQPFADLVRLFELTWYGDYAADSQEFDQGVQFVKGLEQ